MRDNFLSANPKKGRLTEICLIALALFVLSFVVLRAWFHWDGYAVAQVPGSARPPVTLTEVNPFERCAAEARAAEREARVALDRALDVLGRAEHARRPDAIRVAQDAVALAKAALARALARVQMSEANLGASEAGASWVGDPETAARKRALELKLFVPTALANYAPSISRGEFAVATLIRGNVRIKTSEGWAPFTGDYPLLAGDEIKTEDDSQVEFLLDVGSVMRLGPNSKTKLGGPSHWEAIRGRIYAQIKCLGKHNIFTVTRENCQRVRFSGRSGGGAVRGTRFTYEAPEGSPEKLVVFEGTVDFGTLDGRQTIAVPAGQGALVWPDGTVEGPFSVSEGTVERWWERQ
jgi:hypothetical protein